MNILFCGTYLPLSLSRKFKYSSEAALKFQRNLLNELKNSNNIEILSYIPYFDNEVNLLEEDKYVNGIKIKYIKKKLIKNYFKLIFSYSEKMNKCMKNKDIVLLYNYNYINIFTLLLAKKNNVKCYLILADHDDIKFEKNIIKKLIIKIYEWNIKKFNGIIFLSEKLSRGLKNNNNIIIEGGVQLKKYEKIMPPKNNNDLIIMYSGSLEKVSGIDLYLKAIEQIKYKNIKFVFTGKGELAKNIEKLSIYDKRIIYKGMVSEEEYYRSLENSNILINTKNMNLGENLNNFPSKILEYLASGRIIISTKFSGWEKFTDNIKFMDSNIRSFVDVINKTIERNNNESNIYYFKNRERSKEFSWEQQVSKINNFLKFKN